MIRRQRQESRPIRRHQSRQHHHHRRRSLNLRRRCSRCLDSSPRYRLHHHRHQRQRYNHHHHQRRQSYSTDRLCQHRRYHLYQH